MALKPRVFRQSQWNQQLADHVASRAVDWFAEDLGHECDWTSVSLIDRSAHSNLEVVARKSGTIAGLAAAGVVAAVADTGLQWRPLVADGAAVEAGMRVAAIAGTTRSVLAAERVLLNLIGRMSGVATATRRLVDAVAGTPCCVYDTRKTVPGWRLLDKYAVRLGEGWNHRMGLYDGILIKENHIAAAGGVSAAMAEAQRTAPAGVWIQIEVENFTQLDEALAAGATLILLDNMSTAQMREAVNRTAGRAKLEASGGISIGNVREIAETGVDRISIGALTKDVKAVDLSMRFAG